jgi:hypothetical protein
MASLEVTATTDRLILSGKVGRGNGISVFMAVSDGGPEAVAATIAGAQGSLAR